MGNIVDGGTITKWSRPGSTTSTSPTTRDRRRRGPGPARGPSARAYLLILLGDYALDQANAAWTHTVVEALGLVGFEEKAARQALTRSANAGLLDAAASRTPHPLAHHADRSRRVDGGEEPALRHGAGARLERRLAHPARHRAREPPQPAAPAAHVPELGGFRLARPGRLAQPAPVPRDRGPAGARVPGRAGPGHPAARPPGQSRRTATPRHAGLGRHRTRPPVPDLRRPLRSPCSPTHPAEPWPSWPTSSTSGAGSSSPTLACRRTCYHHNGAASRPDGSCSTGTRAGSAWRAPGGATTKPAGKAGSVDRS